LEFAAAFAAGFFVDPLAVFLFAVDLTADLGVCDFV
jgi:hypothetical protein